MSADKIELTLVEFRYKPTVALNYVEWSRSGGEVESAYPGANSHAQNEGEEQIVPDDVRIAIAMLVAPGLVVEAKRADNDQHIAVELMRIAGQTAIKTAREQLLNAIDARDQLIDAMLVAPGLVQS